MHSKDNLPRAYSPKELLRRKIRKLELEGDWRRLIGRPGYSENMYIDGESTSGKSSFVMALADMLCEIDRVLYVAKEEGHAASFQERLERFRMDRHVGRFQVTIDDSLEDIATRLSRSSRSPHFVIVDSVQYCRYKSFDKFKKILLDPFPHKSIIWVGQCDGKKPKGKYASDLMFDAGVKLHTEGYRAFCTGRYNEDPTAYYDIWPEASAAYWLNVNQPKK
ncbi:MAG: bifunctional adenosylcobinamide kinase/adenosylcobinamide-phosphate guanylyltransferase [Bacteroides sp.]|nr:bifunctional adenosylcobinamide kinase/adenosylcobinamide-phosphate guanylyltransferase [Bacteroides sp.]